MNDIDNKNALSESMMQKLLEAISKGSKDNSVKVIVIASTGNVFCSGHNLKEIKTVCWCGRKATMVVRLDKEGNIVSQGEQLEIGGNEKYVPLCRAHFNKKKLGN